jgi:hypothetical protein
MEAAPLKHQSVPATVHGAISQMTAILNYSEEQYKSNFTYTAILIPFITEGLPSHLNAFSL